MNAVIPQAAFR